jgi:uncharacterized protein
MLVNGRGGHADEQQALEMFHKAAHQNHPGAMFALGALYHGGHNVPPDAEMAQRWFREAAERDHPRAQLMLGRYLLAGNAAHQREARRWFEAALGQGLTEAQLELTRLAKECMARPRSASVLLMV